MLYITYMDDLLNEFKKYMEVAARLERELHAKGQAHSMLLSKYTNLLDDYERLLAKESEYEARDY